MSALQPTVDELGHDVLIHLDAQIASARHLLDLVLEQGRAIRQRAVEPVLQKLAEIQAEVERRNHLEAARTELLTRAGQRLGVPAASVTLRQLATLMPPAYGQHAMQRSAELNGLLAEVAREHGDNRAHMRQELTYLSHQTRLAGGEPDTGYRPPAAPVAASPRPATTSHRLLDLQA